jgi:hypothetical protein
MSEGAGEQYKGYYIRTSVRAVNHPPPGKNGLYEGTASVSLDPAARFTQITAEAHLGEDQIFGTEFEAHRHAEKMARRYIDRLDLPG